MTYYIQTHTHKAYIHGETRMYLAMNINAKYGGAELMKTEKNGGKSEARQ